MSNIGLLYNNYTAAAASVSTVSGAAVSNGATSTLKTASSLSTLQTSIMTSLASAISTTSLVSSHTSSQSLSDIKSLGSIMSYSISASTTTASTTTSGPAAISTFSTKTSSSIFSTSSAGASPPSFRILSAYFADTNVTAAASRGFQQQGNLVINTDDLLSSLEIDDPWPGTIKTVSVLYAQGEDHYIFTSTEQSGTFYITPSTTPASAAVPRIGITHGSYMDLIGIVWGARQIKTTSVFDRLYDQQSTGWGFQIGDDLFGVDGLPGVSKVGIIWYLDESGILQSLAGRENAWVMF